MNRANRAFLTAIVISCLAPAGGNCAAAAGQQAPAKQETPRTNRATPNVETSKWKTYRNETFGFEVKYPETWNVHLGNGTGVVLISLDGPIHGEDRPSFSLAIQINVNFEKHSIEDWFAKGMSALRTKPDATGHLTIGGQPAVFMDNTNSFGKHHEIFTSLNKVDVLSLSYTSKAEYDPIYGSIISSFHVAK